jgi:hypothetical protein
VIARLAGVALDARAAARSDDPLERAIASRWIAGNVLAIGRATIARDVVPPGARVLDVRAASLLAVLGALAAVPSLVDPKTLPMRWRLALRALGVPVVDRPIEDVLARGASVVRIIAA